MSPEKHTRVMAVILCLVVGATCTAVARTASDPFEVSRSLASMIVRVNGGEFMPSVDVVRQVSSYDCGPAALANFTRAWDTGREIPALDSIAVLAGTTIHGTRLTGLAGAVQELLGVMPQLDRLDPARIGLDQLPLIAWFDQRHFVVIEDLGTDGRFSIVDPFLGRYVLSPDALARRWTGEALWLPSERPWTQGLAVSAGPSPSSS